MPDFEEKKNSFKDFPLPSSPDSISAARVLEERKGKDFQWAFPFMARNGYEWVEKRQEDIENRRIRFMCPVQDSKTGFCCPAELFPVKTGDSYHYETKKGNYHHHVFAIRSKSISTEVKHNTVSFLDYILEPKKKVKTELKQTVTVYPDRFDVPVDEQEETDPTNILEYYIQTRKCNLTDNMPNSNFRYCDCLVNRDTIKDFRSGYSQFGMPILVVAELVSDEELKNSVGSFWSDAETKNIIVLRDPFQLGSGESDFDRLFFIIGCDNVDLSNSMKRNNRFLVLCNWSLSRPVFIRTDNQEKRAIRIVEGTISKYKDQIRVLNNKLFVLNEYWSNYAFA